MLRKSEKYFLSKSVVKEQEAMILNWKMVDLEIRQTFLTMWMLRHQNRLLREVVDISKLAIFHVRLLWYREICPCPWQRSWTRWSIFERPFQPKLFYDSMILWMLHHQNPLENMNEMQGFMTQVPHTCRKSNVCLECMTRVLRYYFVHFLCIF